MSGTPSQIGPILRFLHDVTEFSRPPIGSPRNVITSLGRVPDISFEAVAAQSKKAQELLAKLERFDLEVLPRELSLTLRLAGYDLRRISRSSDMYWLVVDGMGVGFYGMFTWSAYGGAFLLNVITSYMRNFRFEVASDTDRYLAIVSDIARLLGQFNARTKGQAERHIYMPKRQIEQAVPLIGRLRTMLTGALKVDPTRLGNLDVPRFEGELEQRIEQHFAKVFDEALAIFDDQYRSQAPDQVGLMQYPGGEAVYEELVRFHTTVDLSPMEIHQAGLERMKRVRAAMAGIRRDVGFTGTDQEYVESLMSDPAWRADTVDGVKAVFDRYIKRMESKYDEYFDFQSAVPYGVAPLPEALAAGMTFGFYDMPRPDKPRGDYLFNGANLINTQLSNVAAYTYHELIPGHHLHMSTQQANDAVHPLHNDAFFNAFNEGWAEYAATLADEAGLYREPAEKFGRLVNEAFLTCRLVVDTGMNAFGWTIERARAYMRENSFISEKEVDSESIRYSCDIPGQSLAYKIGDAEMMRLRDKFEAARGDRYDIRDFHRIVLSSGGMPFPLLEWHMEESAKVLATS